MTSTSSTTTIDRSRFGGSRRIEGSRTASLRHAFTVRRRGPRPAATAIRLLLICAAVGSSTPSTGVPLLDAAARCQQAAGRAGRVLEKIEVTAWEKCLNGLLTGAGCDAAARDARIAKAETAFAAAIGRRCTRHLLFDAQTAGVGFPLTCDLEPGTTGAGETLCAALPVADPASLATCLACWRHADARELVQILYPCLASQVAPDPPVTCAGGASSCPTDAADVGCLRAVGKAGIDFMLATEQAQEGCLDGVRSGRIVGPCPDLRAQALLAAAEHRKLAQLSACRALPPWWTQCPNASEGACTPAVGSLSDLAVCVDAAGDAIGRELVCAQYAHATTDGISCPPGAVNATTTSTTLPGSPTSTTTTTQLPTTTSTTATPTTTSTTTTTTTLPPPVFLIVMGSGDWGSIKGNPSAPFINGSLLPIGAHAESYFNPPGIHPDEPNYLWLEAGTNFGILIDGTPATQHQGTTSHLVSLLDAAGIPWRAYQEGITGTTCPLVDQGSYLVRHDPFVFFDDVTGGNDPNDAYCIAHVRPYSELQTDLAADTVASYNFITPDLCDDMRSACPPLNDPISQGDAWLSTEVPNILASQAYQSGGVLLITWDQGLTGDGPIGLIVLSPKAKVAYQNGIHYTHSSTLRTVEELLGVSPLLNDAANATDLSDLFTTFP
jgi:hypothetical protein